MDAKRSIVGMTVCVDYSEQLSHGLVKWRDGLDRMIVVSAPRDGATVALCEAYDVPYHLTEVFWAKKAKFNKGAAMAEAYRELAPTDWMLFFDADIEPPEGWRDQLGELVPGNLYGARRVEHAGEPISDPDLAGFFHLAHVSDRHMCHDPIVDTHFFHAGNYDTTFQNRWARSQRLWVPFTVIHRGTPGKNWCGVGNEAEVEKIHRERRRRRGRWDHETI